MRAPDGRYDRFETTITNSIVPLDQLLATVQEVGWRETYLAAPTDLRTPLRDELGTIAAELPRVCVISRRPPAG